MMYLVFVEYINLFVKNIFKGTNSKNCYIKMLIEIFLIRNKLFKLALDEMKRRWSKTLSYGKAKAPSLSISFNENFNCL